MLFADLDAALARAKERAAAQAQDEPYLKELLQVSYGVHKTTGEIIYRPFWVAAKFIEQSRRDQSLKKADGAEFTGQVVPIESLYDLQRSLDSVLIVPTAYQIADKSAVAATVTAAQLKAGYDAALLSLQQFRPRGFF